MSNRIYYQCQACDSIVYREPGKTYGDGQVDTDEHPVYLHYCSGDAEDWPGKRDSLNEDEWGGVIRDCGCLGELADQHEEACYEDEGEAAFGRED